MWGPSECDCAGHKPGKSALTRRFGHFPGALQLPGPLFQGCVLTMTKPPGPGQGPQDTESYDKKQFPWAVGGLGQLQLPSRQEADRVQCPDGAP